MADLLLTRRMTQNRETFAVTTESIALAKIARFREQQQLFQDTGVLVDEDGLIVRHPKETR